jgi:hypothetical protein
MLPPAPLARSVDSGVEGTFGFEYQDEPEEAEAE